MDWTDEEARRLYEQWAKGHGDADDVLALASLAVELARARGGILRDDQIAAMWRIVESGQPFGNLRTRELLDSHAAQGATVATLQAKVAQHDKRLTDVAAERDALQTRVAELEKVSGVFERHLYVARDERDAARDEVESRGRTEESVVGALAALGVDTSHGMLHGVHGIIAELRLCAAHAATGSHAGSPQTDAGRTILRGLAEVERERERADTLHRTWERAEKENAGLRADVERLEAEREVMQRRGEGMKEAIVSLNTRVHAAEFRLAAVREQATRASAELRHAYRALLIPGAQIDPNLVACAIRLLEGVTTPKDGDAPNSPGSLDGSGGTDSPAAQLVRLAVEAGLPVHFVPRQGRTMGGTLDPTEGLPEPESRATMRVVSGGTAEQRAELQALGVEVRAGHPCSPTCTHDDAAKPGHPERVKERSEAVAAAIGFTPTGGPVDVQDGFDWGENEPDPYQRGADAMRAVVEAWARDYFGSVPPTLKAAIEGVAS